MAIMEYILFWILDMFETLLEGLTIVATQYSPSYCLVMFASKMPGGKHYLNRLLVNLSRDWILIIDLIGLLQTMNVLS